MSCVYEKSIRFEQYHRESEVVGIKTYLDREQQREGKDEEEDRGGPSKTVEEKGSVGFQVSV